jgi:hypothetical protein
MVIAPLAGTMSWSVSPKDQRRVRGDPGEPFLWRVQVIGGRFPGVLVSGVLAPQGELVVILMDTGTLADGDWADWREGE